MCQNYLKVFKIKKNVWSLNQRTHAYVQVLKQKLNKSDPTALKGVSTAL